MNSYAGKRPFACTLLLVLQALLGFGALFGGGALMIDPSGAMIGMPPDLLKSSPFDSFLIPAIILFSMLGVVPLIVGLGLWRKWHWNLANILNVYKNIYWAWTFSLYIGFALLVWIFIQTYLIQAVSVVHLIYFALGLMIQIVTLLPSVRQYYTKTE